MRPRNLALLLVLLLVSVLLLAFFPFPGFAAQISQSLASYPVRGTVLNSVTGEPIRGALVQIYANRQRSVLTGADGSFQFENVPAGTLNFNVQKPGYFALQAIQSPRAQAAFAFSGPDQPPTVVKLVPEGVISGRIRGDNGEPVESLLVQIFAERVENGKKTRAILNGRQTDEEGEFRIAELQPGRYFVFAGPSSAPEVDFEQGTQPAARGYAVAFYPGVADIASANAVEVAAGQHMEINFDLASQPFHRISGTVSGYPMGKVGINLQVTNAAGQEMNAGFRFDERTGMFRTVWLPGGSYTLTAEMQDPGGAHVYFASQAVNLSSDLAGIRLHLLPSVSIPLSFRMETTRSEGPLGTETFVTRGPRGEQRRQVTPPPARAVLTTQNQGFSQQQRWSQFVEGNEPAVEIANVPPGVYSVEVFANGAYYVQSARCGGLNLLEQNLTVAPGSAVGPIEVVLRDDFGSLDGSVALGAGDESVMVIAIPEDGHGRVRNVEVARPAGTFDAARSTVGFEMSQLAPGRYRVLAVDRPNDFEYGNPEVVQKYASKTREITVGTNQQAKIELEVVHIGE